MGLSNYDHWKTTAPDEADVMECVMTGCTTTVDTADRGCEEHFEAVSEVRGVIHTRLKAFAEKLGLKAYQWDGLTDEIADEVIEKFSAEIL